MPLYLALLDALAWYVADLWLRSEQPTIVVGVRDPELDKRVQTNLRKMRARKADPNVH